MTIKAMKQALEALETLNSGDTYKTHNAATALRAAIEQAEKPVAWADKYDIEREGHDFYVNRQQPAKDGVPLYTAPPQREWVGLTNEEVGQLIPGYAGDASGVDLYWLITEIEAKLKEKNTQ
jgi:hypothetical protein